MIFSNSTSENFYLLSKIINCYDIFILNKIINETFIAPKPAQKPEAVKTEEPTKPNKQKEKGTLVVRCESWGWIHLDGKAIGTCPINGKAVPIGEHLVELQDDFGSIKQKITIKAGKRTTVDFR